MYRFTLLWTTQQFDITKTPSFYHSLSIHIIVVCMYHGLPHIVIHHPYTCDGRMLHHLLPMGLPRLTLSTSLCRKSIQFVDLIYQHLLITFFEVLHPILQLLDTSTNWLWFVYVGDKQIMPHSLVWYPCYSRWPSLLTKVPCILILGIITTFIWQLWSVL